MAPLLRGGDEAAAYFARRDLLGEDVPPVQVIWGLPAVQSILRRQKPDGSWPARAAKLKRAPSVKHPLVETYRNLRSLVDQYELTRLHPAVERAAEYVFGCQTAEGDIRGILCNQYAPYYTGAILYLLIKAGYAADQRVAAGLAWLLSMRQDDGGWVIGSPGMVGLAGLSSTESNALTSRPDRVTARAFDRPKPFSAAGCCGS
ncbi:MAG: terpene cyclase/mutase family protein [Bacillota bacterium]|nr:terpene cyclase/mutase family protein [Bacillota bacterium]